LTNQAGDNPPHCLNITKGNTMQPSDQFVKTINTIQNLDKFLTLDNAIKYNNQQNKLFFIADELDISATGRKVLIIEDLLCKILEANNIPLND
jgi:hypoxanthine-guanine phosphoribosyltransferase